MSFKKILTIILWILGISVWLVIISYSSYLYYSASCKQIKDFPVPVNVPNRCIGELNE